MTAASIGSPARVTTGPSSALWPLARLEIRRYLMHPLYWFGLALSVVAIVVTPDARTSVTFNVFAPAAGLGVFGIVIMAALARRSDTINQTAGVVPVPERTRSLALVIACLVPFTTALVWWVVEIVIYGSHHPPANGYPFGPVSDGWIFAGMFGESVMVSLGGPLLGLLVARWIPRRAAPALTAVVVVAVGVAFQGGLIDQVRRIRLISPFTYFGGPAGVKGDPNRAFLYTGSPYWWCVYLGCLCALGVIGVLLHDREVPRGPLLRVAGVVGVATVIVVVVAMYTGLPHTIINPLHG